MRSVVRSSRAVATALLLCFALLSQTLIAQDTIENAAPPEEDTTSANIAFSNSTPITINDVPTPPAPATPYPSTVAVTGLTGSVTKVTVTINGFSHAFPDDVDMMLVAPNGSKIVMWSDVGGSPVASNLTITLDDAAAALMPDAGPLASGTYKPTAVNTTTDNFPAPAPARNTPGDFAAPAGTQTFATAFNGMTAANANGTWSLYIIDDTAGDAGSISGGWTLNITQAAVPADPNSVKISEFRVRGPNGANDEFIELYNNTNGPITVSDATPPGAGTTGWAVVASDGVTRFVVPSGTVIPARGHYLGVNSVGYSLASYPAGNGTTATGDATYTTDIPDNAGIAIFNTANSANFTVANRLDAVGSTSEANTLYKEGAGYPALTPFSIDYSFYRDNCGKAGSITTFGNCPSNGAVIDTNNNAADFIFVDTNGTSAGAGQRLGAPGPQNLSSPIDRNSTISAWALDGTKPNTSAPNRVRDLTSDPANNSTFGTLSIRRRFTNNTGGNVTRLRFRIIDITTFPAPSGVADLRARTSSAVVVSGITDTSTCPGGVTPCTVTVQGTTLEQPPSQPNGGAFNSSLSAGTVTLATPLANGASINVQFLLGVQQTGSFKFLVNVEALP